MGEVDTEATTGGAPAGDGAAVEHRDAGPLTALCSVTFHLTEGQKVDACYPDGALTADELGLVAFHAFPVSPGAACATAPPRCVLATPCRVTSYAPTLPLPPHLGLVVIRATRPQQCA
jgi:hypothetical protein